MTGFPPDLSGVEAFYVYQVNLRLPGDDATYSYSVTTSPFAEMTPAERDTLSRAAAFTAAEQQRTEPFESVLLSVYQPVVPEEVWVTREIRIKTPLPERIEP